MSDQTTTNTPSEPVLCTQGCGFFGNPTTGNYCSKCWREVQKKNKDNESPPSSAASPSPSPMEVCTPATPAPASPQPNASASASVSTIEPSSTPVASAPAVAAAPTTATAPAPKVVKKKKKKTSYKAMMANMTKRTKDEKDIEKEKEGLRKVTGGGAFTKIDKI